MTHLTPVSQYRTIVVVDVVGFTDPSRHTPDRLSVRNGMYEVLKTAFAECAVDFDSCDSEDRGDGALVLVPSNVSKNILADRLPDRIVAALRRYNSTRIPQAQFKLRIAVNSGDILYDGNGWVGSSVDTSFRILDAPEAKAALAESNRMVAFISSEHFYADVIEQDPGTMPESYRPIAVSVKSFSGTAWLRLLGEGMPATGTATTIPTSRLPPDADTLERVPTVIPFAELDTLRDCLTMEGVPRLAVIMSRAVGPAIPIPPRSELRTPWDAFTYLADFNAGPDGIPPAVSFLEQLAGELGGDVGAVVTRWIGEQAQRLRLGPALDKQRLTRAPVPDEPHLHLTIMLEPDAIDPDRCVLASWRQDDPRVWPPTLGNVREVTVEELEYRVDEVILEAEGVWAGQGISAAVEFLLPRTLLHLPVQHWRKEHDSGRPRLLRYDYRLSLRSLERMRAKHWHRAWHMRWDSMLENPSADRLHYSGSAEFEEHPIDAVLSDPRWIGLVMAETPSPQPGQDTEPDELVAALRGGLPVIFWHPNAGPTDLHDLVDWVLGGESGFLDLPARRKLANLPTTGPFNDDSLVRDLVVMWDDPKRVIVLDQPLIPARQ